MTAPPPEQPTAGAAETNIFMNEMIQAEIAQRVAMALQAHSIPSAPAQRHSGLLVFPSKKVSA